MDAAKKLSSVFSDAPRVDPFSSSVQSVPRLTSIITKSGSNRVLRSTEHSPNDQMTGEMQMAPERCTNRNDVSPMVPLAQQLHCSFERRRSRVLSEGDGWEGRRGTESPSSMVSSASTPGLKSARARPRRP
jgi:hypothetical protein